MDVIEGLRKDWKIEKEKANTGQGRTDEHWVRIEEMRYLRHTEKWTLREIGDLYELSRERVRQLIGNTGHGFVIEKIENTISQYPDLTNEELAEVLNRSEASVSSHRNGTRHAIKGGNFKKGTDVEEMVSRILGKYNIKHRLMPHRHIYDIELANGKKADVKAAFKTTLPKSRKKHGANPYYRFGVRKKQDEVLDFYICVVVPTKDIFVVPAEHVTSTLQIVWPKVNRTSKWYKYCNRFDLLR